MSQGRDTTRRLDAGGGPASWCRDVVTATRSVHHVTESVGATCATARKEPSVVRGPLFGSCLADVLDRPAPPAVQQPATPAPRTRVRPTTPEPATTQEVCPPGQQPRHRPSVTPLPQPARPEQPMVRTPDPGAHRTSVPAPLPPVDRREQRIEPDCPPDEVPGSPARAARLTDQPASCRVPAGHLLALAGPTRSLEVASSEPRSLPRPRTPQVRRPRPTAPAEQFAPGVADRLVRRLGTDVPTARLLRRGLRPLEPQDTPTKAQLLALAVPTRVVATPSDAAPVPPRRRRAGTPPTPAPTPTPRTDETAVRTLGGFAEQPTEPARLPADDRSDEAASGLGGAFQAAGRREMPAVPGPTPGAVAGLAEPDLERLMTRVLDDAARRHGIEV